MHSKLLFQKQIEKIHITFRFKSQMYNYASMFWEVLQMSKV